MMTVTFVSAMLVSGLAMLPVGWMKSRAERQLSADLGAPVRIGALEREDAFSFVPTIRVRDIRVAQPQWVDPTSHPGPMAQIGLLSLRVPLLALLDTGPDVRLVSARHVRLDLIRAGDRRENWRFAGGTGDGGIDFSGADIDDAVLRYSDAVQKRSARLGLRIEPRTGLTIEGAGAIGGAPVQLRAQGGPLVPGRPWRFAAAIEGASALVLHVSGQMDAPLDTASMAFRFTTRADDLKRVDRVIEAGLFGTQRVDLTADVTHRNRAWHVTKLRGTIGRSALEGAVTADQSSGRTVLDGRIHFLSLDFDDLASSRGLARARARTAAEGPRFVPDTRVNIRKISKTDGRIAVTVDRVLPSGSPTAITALSATLRLDDRVLTIAPLRIALTQGAVTGSAVVYQRDGRPSPRVSLDLTLTDSRLSTLSTGGLAGADGRVDGRARLIGTGDTIRAAVAAADGRIGLAARAGDMPTKTAALLGFNLGQALTSDADSRTSLRCAAALVVLHGGTGTLGTLVADTDIGQITGTGTIRFPQETLAVTLQGRPKGKAALRLPGTVGLAGTIRHPALNAPQKRDPVGTLLKAVGRSITGNTPPQATDVDCAGLIPRILRP